MRVSVNTFDPGYKDDAGFYDIFFKGVLMPNVITADEEEKMILCWVYDDRGQRIKHPDKPGHYLTEMKFGEVHLQRRKAKAHGLSV